MRHTRLIAPVLLVPLLALAGCSGSSGDTSRTSASATKGAPTKVASSQAAPSTEPTASSSAEATPAGPGACLTDDLRVGLTGGEGAAGSTYYQLTLTNTSDHPCRTGGFGGVSLVGDGSGKQIGAPADRTKADQVTRIELAPGDTATATLQVADAGNYSASKCEPADAEGFRVYPPNETHSAYVEQGTPACRNDKVHLLTLTPYQPEG